VAARTSISTYLCTSISTYLRMRTPPDTIDTPTSGSHLAYVLGVGGARVAAPGVLGRSDQLHSYSETVGSDWSGDNMDYWNLETTLL
jgi:hypothetical protein